MDADELRSMMGNLAGSYLTGSIIAKEIRRCHKEQEYQRRHERLNDPLYKDLEEAEAKEEAKQAQIDEENETLIEAIQAENQLS